MKKNVFTILASFWIGLFAIAQDRISAPMISCTTPEFGDCNVDTALTEIIIKFDQDMAPGMSLVNNPNMPVSNGTPKWIDKRTFSIPVKLYANKLYALTFNNSRFRNFTNTSGISLNPDQLLFQTTPVPKETQNKKAYSELLEVFPKHYSYATRKGIDWVVLLKKYQAELENAKTNTEFAIKLIKLLRAAEDPHLWIEVGGIRFETEKIKFVERNYGSKGLYTILQNKKATNGFTSITGAVDNVGYISIRDWTTDLNKLSFKLLGDAQNPEIPSQKVLTELFRFPNLIIDVRENTGGNESYAKEFASCFVKDSIPYEKVANFNENTGLFNKEHLKILYPTKKDLFYSGNVYVLSGPSVMSSNESFVLMMKQAPKATVIGMKTYGSSGNPIPYNLANGVKVYLPSWQAYMLDGKLIEGNGIDPDLEIITSKRDFGNRDVLVDEVLKMIKK